MCNIKKEVNTQTEDDTTLNDLTSPNVGHVHVMIPRIVCVCSYKI